MSIVHDTTKNRKTDVFVNLMHGLTRTRRVFVDGIASIFVTNQELEKKIDALAAKLLTADVGVVVTKQLSAQLEAEFKGQTLIDGQQILAILYKYLENILNPCEQPLAIKKDGKPFVILVVGVNGVGKTTTIGKLARKLQFDNYRIMLAAGDTFRAAAIDQLKIWGERIQVPVIAQQPGADGAAVIYDAYQAACARNVDVLIADTAGRLHTNSNFMEELKKVKKVLQKNGADLPQEILLVLDATTGQNTLNQVKQFVATLGVTGICLTKLDGTARGGAIFAIAQETKIPLRFIGVGEKINDLQPFVAQDFVAALFANET